MYINQLVNEMQKNRIRVYIDGQSKGRVGDCKFGGVPDVPNDFAWPYYVGESPFDKVEKSRPLSFLAQFNCAELSQYDTEGLLPKSGLLSFFYEEESAPWGFDPKHKGCARVYYFEDITKLAQTVFPEDLGIDFRNPEIGIRLKQQISIPSMQDISMKYEMSDEEYEEFEKYIDDESCVHQILGWPGILQNNITSECELIRKGWYLGSGWKDIPTQDIEHVQKESLDKWQLLFQLDEVEYEDFYLSFGDCGRLYFYITKEDLKQCNFENMWMVYQCL